MTAPAPRSERSALARELLPTLLHDIANTTQRLVGVRALLELEDDALAGGAGADLAWAAERAHEQGWLMGLMGAALDVDILLERRWSKGFEATLALVAGALGRVGRVCRVQRSEIPGLSGAPSAPRDSELCLALAEIVLAAGGSEPVQPLELVVEHGGARWTLRGSSGSAAARVAYSAVASQIPGADFESDGEAWAVLLPEAWFRHGAG